MEILSLGRLGGVSALRDWKRSGWLIMGVILGLAFFVAISTLGAGYSELVRLPFSRLKSDLIVQLGTKGKSQVQEKGSIRLPFSNQPLAKKQIEAIASFPGVQTLNPAILLWHQEKKNFVTVAGVNPTATASGPARVMQWIKKGRPIKRGGETVVESHHAKFHKLKIGNAVRFGNSTYTIVGITTIKEGASLAAANFYITIGEARNLANMADGSANLLSVGLERGVETQKIQDQITALLPGAIVSSTDSIGHMMRGFAGISTTATRLLSYTALGFTILLVCWLIGGRLQEQKGQIGLMQTMGWQKKDILFNSCAEALSITLLGGIVGIGLGLLLVQALGSFEVSLTLPWNLAPTPGGLHKTGAGRTMLVPLPIVLEPLKIVSALFMTCLAASLTSLVGSARLAGKGVRQTLFE